MSKPNKQEILAYIIVAGFAAFTVGIFLAGLFGQQPPPQEISIEPSPSPIVEKVPPVPEEIPTSEDEAELTYAPTDANVERQLMLKKQGVLEIFISDQEPMVRDAFWNGPIFWVFVEDDGSNFKGYAEYVCRKLKDYGLDPSAVEVNDYFELIDRDNKTRKNLALVLCR